MMIILAKTRHHKGFVYRYKTIDGKRHKFCYRCRKYRSPEDWEVNMGLTTACDHCSGFNFYGMRLPFYLEPEHPQGSEIALERRKDRERRRYKKRHKTLFNLINGPSPCKQCKNYDLCAEGFMCSEFDLWVKSASMPSRYSQKKGSRFPDREIYLRHFPTKP